MFHPMDPTVRRSTTPAAPSFPQRSRDARSGFSLIELLTVIAIIAILAAVIFPMASVVRVRAQQNQVISNLHAIQASLGMYKLDEHGYPPTLGPLVVGNGQTTTTYNALYPEWLKDRGAFESPSNDVEDPNVQVSVAPTQPNVDKSVPGPGQDPATQASGAKFFAWDTMDGHVENNAYILHYNRFRTGNANDPDYKRQMGFRNPPEDTVVTWNDTFVNKTTGKGDYLVLFLNGQVKKIGADKVNALNGQVWRLKPY